MYKLAILNVGFVPLYVEFLKDICKENNVILDVLELNSYTEKDLEKYDYVICDELSLKGCVKVSHQHTIEYQIHKAENWIYKILYRLSHLSRIKQVSELNKSYSKIICVSNEIKKDYQKYYNIPSDKLIVANAGFVPPNQDNDNKEFKKYKKEEPFVVCTSAVGFVTKGGYTLLSALRCFRKMYPDIKIKANIIYPKYSSNLAVKLYVKLFQLDDIVEFFGYLDDINAFYNKANCLTSQSIYEAFGRIVTEAMYQKIPVIVGSNIGASDIIEDNVNGFIFEDNKEKSRNLAMKIKEVYDKYNELEPVVERAYETSKKTTWANFAKKVFYGLYPNLHQDEM